MTVLKSVLKFLKRRWTDYVMMLFVMSAFNLYFDMLLLVLSVGVFR